VVQPDDASALIAAAHSIAGMIRQRDMGSDS
jgi:hypothetical protein